MYLSIVLLLVASGLAAAIGGSLEHHWGRNQSWIKSFDNLVAFGDSYTDEDRLSYFIGHNGSAPPPGTLLPPSNSTAGGGVTWDRWVADYTGAKLYDYAVAGAVCDNNIVYRYLASVFGPFPDVVYEVNAFIADVKYINESTKTNTLYTDRRSDNTVYSIWIGTNDLGEGAFLTDSSNNGTTIVDYVDCVYDRLDSVYKTGGRYFVIMNNAPLQLSPLYGMPGLDGTVIDSNKYWPNKYDFNATEISGKMKEYTKLANDIFAYRTPYELLVAKRYPGASFAVFDTNSLLTDVYNNPAEYFTSPANVTGNYYLCDATGANCHDNSGTLHQYMWYDELHPSERTDQIIAAEFVKVVKGTSAYATYW